jgi:predicted membrane GTPase involved in stress response
VRRLTKELEKNFSHEGNWLINSWFGHDLSVLIETMRREGYENKSVNHRLSSKKLMVKKMPIEELTIDLLFR